MRTRLVLVIAVLAVVAAAVWYFRGSGAAAGPAISTVPVTRGNVVRTVDATGTLAAVTTVQVGTQVSGTIKALYADFNAEVREGQVIAELEPSLFQAQVEQARASLVRLQAEALRARVQLEDAQQKLRRARDLHDRQLIPVTELETAETNSRQAEAALQAAEAQIVQARASLNQAQVNLGHTIIRSPIDGIVISRNVDVGQTVAASMQAPTLYVIARSLEDMQVDASVAESDIGPVRAGLPVTFTVDAYPGRIFTGTVSLVRLDPVIEQNVVSYVTTIAVPNPSLLLKPGMTANVTIEIDRADDVLRVPNAALRVRPTPAVFAALGQPEPPAMADGMTGEPPDAPRGTSGANGPQPGAGPAVWVLRNGRLERVVVRTSTADAGYTAILEGALAEGDAVVTSITMNGAAVAPAAGTGTSPLLPTRPGRGGSAPRTR